MDLKWITQMAERVHELENENKRLKGLLEEQDNKRGPDMTKPQPCTKFANAAVEEWVAKLNEEMYEVMREAADIERLADEADDEDKLSLATCLAIELTDVIHVCVSWLDAIGYNEEARGDLHLLVNEKNKARGYF